MLHSRRATPGFGTGGTIRTRTGGLVIPNHARFLCATAPCGRAIGISYRTAAVFPMRHRSFPVAGSSFRSAREQKKRGDKGGMPAPLCRRQVSNLLPLAFRQRTARCATAACTEISCSKIGYAEIIFCRCLQSDPPGLLSAAPCPVTPEPDSPDFVRNSREIRNPETTTFCPFSYS